MSSLRQFAGEWKAEVVKAAPTGPTGNLKRSFYLAEYGRRIRLASTSPYARRIALESVTHVSRSEVGRIGWQAYGKGRTRVQRYWSGLRLGKAGGAQAYVWEYYREALIRLGGTKRYREILRGMG